MFALALGAIACAGSQATAPASVPASIAPPSVAAAVLVSEIEWEQLNPARGDASPMAATLWGDRNGSGPTGFLVRFVDGFRSPPHIHNVSYRGVVIRGGIHNDHPSADEMWMPAGSFWTQPKGGAHVTAARGNNLAYIEIDEGPYLVRPVEDAFECDERPMNVNASKIVWMDTSRTAWSDQLGITVSAHGSQFAFLSGDSRNGQPRGILVKLQAGSRGMLRSHGSTLRAVVIQGSPEVRLAGDNDVAPTEPGSYVSAPAGGSVQFSCKMEKDCILHVRLERRIDEDGRNRDRSGAEHRGQPHSR
ncbi:MAG: DUF4437 domain-containing protein [Myxococcota bacterium]